MGIFFSPGKLLLTSEYVVLDGALALAIPTKVGQDLVFQESEDEKYTIHWQGFHQKKLWLKVIIDYRNWEIVETNLPDAAAFVLKVLKSVQRLSTAKFQNKTSYFINTNLQFPPNFGLGSSSTLMNNLAMWADIDAFALNDSSLGGSGYDVAVAQEKSAILFQIRNDKREIEAIKFQPPFYKDLTFVHLNEKQNSREGISLYRSKNKSQDLVNEFSKITRQVYNTNEIEEFSSLMDLHEELLAGFLQISTAKEKFFQDCPVFIKSLGAWGGDFILTSKFVDFEKYFKNKGFTTIIDWQDLIY